MSKNETPILQTPFEAAPTQVGITVSAWPEWTRLIEVKGSDLAAMQYLIDLHVQNVRTYVGQTEMHDGDTGLFVSDVDGFDLCVVDMHIPSMPFREVTLQSRAFAMGLQAYVESGMATASPNQMIH